MPKEACRSGYKTQGYSNVDTGTRIQKHGYGCKDTDASRNKYTKIQKRVQKKGIGERHRHEYTDAGYSHKDTYIRIRTCDMQRS